MVEVERSRWQSMEEMDWLKESLAGVEKKLATIDGHLAMAITEGMEAFK